MRNKILLAIPFIIGLVFFTYCTGKKSSSAIKFNHLIFKTAEGESAYIQAYDKSMALWTVPYETNFVKTRFGNTYVIICGPKDGEPLLLISGKAESSAYWFSNVTDLSKKYRIYAIDKIGDWGKSITEKYPENMSDLCDWLIDVMDELSIKKANIAGHSLGGWMTLGFAINHPERIKKIVLLSPAGSFCKTSGGFMWRGGRATLLPSRGNIKKFQNWLHLRIELICEQGIIGWQNQNWRHKMITPAIFSDTELKQLNAPVLFLIGSEDFTKTCTPIEEITKAQSLITHFEGEVIPNVGHNFPLEQPEIVNKRILNFLN
jgi:pimeloyl-ACP methyl ester carboxylesterase